MCTTCGCGTDEVKIDGVDAGHDHEHVHADGTRHAVHGTDDHSHDERMPRPRLTAHRHDHAHASRTRPCRRRCRGPQGPRRMRTRRAFAPSRGRASRGATSWPRTTPTPRPTARCFADRGIFALNLVSSPGSGKTTLLVQDDRGLRGAPPVAVIEGDQQTSHDADRIRATGAPAVQINTGKGCHLDAHMVGHALRQLGARRRQPADDRERRQPGLPRRVRPGRGAQGGDPVGDRRRGQAAQVSRHVPRRRPDAAQQDRPAAAPRVRRRRGDRRIAQRVRPRPRGAARVGDAPGEGFDGSTGCCAASPRRGRARDANLDALRRGSRSCEGGAADRRGRN